MITLIILLLEFYLDEENMQRISLKQWKNGDTLFRGPRDLLLKKACMIAALLDDLWNDMLPAEGVRIAAQQLLGSTAFSEKKSVAGDISSEKITSGNSFEEKLSTKEGVTGEILDLFVKMVKGSCLGDEGERA